MQLKPTGDHIIVKALDEKTTASGIIIPATADKERPERGEVLAVGPGRILENGQRRAIEVKVGEKVVFKKYAADEVKIEKDTFLVISSDDVIAIIE